MLTWDITPVRTEDNNLGHQYALKMLTWDITAVRTDDVNLGHYCSTHR